MNRSLSWIDPESWSALIKEAGLTQGAASSPPSPVAAPVAPPPLASSAPASAEEMPALGVGPTEGDNLEMRLQRYAGRLTESAKADAVFISDEAGLEIVSHGAEESVIALSAVALPVFEQMRTLLKNQQPGAATLLLADNRKLHLVELATPRGRYSLGIVGNQEISATAFRGYRDELTALITHEGST